MSAPLIDRLYDSKLGIYTDLSQGSLIVYPPILNRWDVSSSIVSNWGNYIVVIVTDYPNEFTESTMYLHTNKFSSKWTDLELIPYPTIGYEDFIDINRALKNTEIDIILFDDAKILATIMPTLDITHISPKILVLTTWGDNIQQLNVITENLPDIYLLSLDIHNNRSGISWKTCKVKMSNRQLIYYSHVRAKESKESKDSISYPLTRMMTLYTYPDDIVSNFPNISHVSTIYNDGPKLKSILDSIILNYPLKQLVITRFNRKYGVDLITSFLKLMIFNKEHLCELFHTSCTDKYETSLNIFNKFNSSTSGILITNIVPLISLENISVVHIVDSYSFRNILAVLDKVHLIEGNSDIVVCSYVAIHPDEKSADEVLHDNLVSNIMESNRIYSGLISMSNYISSDT